jgi:hypothetical protein
MAKNIDPNNPTGVESFFHYYGTTGVQFNGYVNLPGYTVEQLYQAFKARILEEISDFSNLWDDDLPFELDGQEQEHPSGSAESKKRGRKPGSKNKPKHIGDEPPASAPGDEPPASAPGDEPPGVPGAGSSESSALAD